MKSGLNGVTHLLEKGSFGGKRLRVVGKCMVHVETRGTGGSIIIFVSGFD